MGGRTHLLLALAIRPLTTHPFRDGATFLPLTTTTPTFGRPVRFFHILYLYFFACLMKVFTEGREGGVREWLGGGGYAEGK